MDEMKSFVSVRISKHIAYKHHGELQTSISGVLTLTLNTHYLGSQVTVT